MAKLVLEVAAESPVDHLAVANSLEDELARINALVSQLEDLSLEIQVADADSYVTAEQTQEAQQLEIAAILDPAKEQVELYVRKCKELELLANRV